ncbi:MAG: hypothetical protein R2909_03205 [Gemmatimonadales bacterium]
MAAAVVLAGAFWALKPSNETLTVGATRRLSVGASLELDPILSPDGKLLAYAAGSNGAMRIEVRQLDGGDPVMVAPDVAGNQRLPSWSPDGSRIRFQSAGSIFEVPALGGRADQLVEGAAGRPAESPAWTRDGRTLAYVLGGEILLRQADAAPTRLIADGEAHSLAWSPDGEWLAYVSGNRDFALGETLLGNVAPSRLMLIRRSGGEPVALTDGKSLAVSPVWRDDRTLLYVSDAGGLRDIYAQSLAGGSPRGSARRLTTGLGAHGIHLSADGSRLTVAAIDQTSNVWALALPEQGVASIRDAEPVTSGAQIVEDFDVLPGGGWLLFDSNQNGNQDIFVQSLSSRRPTQISQDSADEFGPVWSPNGKEVAYYSVVNGVRHVFVMRATGRDVRQVTDDSLGDHQPQWAPDGEHLVFYRRDGVNRDRIYTVARNVDSTWSEPNLVIDEFATGVSWSKDGRWLAFTDQEGAIRIVSSTGGISRVVATPVALGAAALKRPQWLPFEPALLVRGVRAGGQGSIWWIPIDGSPPMERALFDDPNRPVLRDDFVTDGENVYFAISQLDGTLWMIDLVAEAD